MKSGNGFYWLFVESKSRVLSKRLSQTEAEEFLVGLTEKDINSWWAWNPTFKDWIALKKIVDFKEAKLRLLINLPQTGTTIDRAGKQNEKKNTTTTHIPENLTDVKDFLRDEAIDDMRDFHGDDLSPSRAPNPPKLGLGDDRRRADRVEKSIEVIIASGSKVFRTKTLNIAESGVFLEAEIPTDLKNGPFEIVFILYRNGVKKQLVYQGKVSGDAMDRRRLKFGALTKSNVTLLEEIRLAD